MSDVIPSDEAAPAETEGRSTHFTFTHRVFEAPEARFTLGSDGVPSFVVKLGDYDAAVPLESLKIEFPLIGTSDDKQIDRVIAGLRFVKVIRPGDSIPREILDGTA